jgi:putative transposase
LLEVLVTAAGVHDRDAGRLLLWALHTCFTHVTKVWADGGYQGQLVDWATTTL